MSQTSNRTYFARHNIKSHQTVKENRWYSENSPHAKTPHPIPSLAFPSQLHTTSSICEAKRTRHPHTDPIPILNAQNSIIPSQTCPSSPPPPVAAAPIQVLRRAGHLMHTSVRSSTVVKPALRVGTAKRLSRGITARALGGAMVMMAVCCCCWSSCFCDSLPPLARASYSSRPGAGVASAMCMPACCCCVSG